MIGDYLTKLESNLAAAHQREVGYQIQLNEKSTRISELEAERESTTVKLLAKRVAALEAERDEERTVRQDLDKRLSQSRVAERTTHNDLTAARARVAELEAERAAFAEEKKP